MKSKIEQLLYISFLMVSFFSLLISSGKTRLFADDGVMGVEEIVPGMKGYGKTVFIGDRIEMFSVEVLGVLRNWEAKSNMILIKMSGGPLEKSGIIAGMSGSPVYIDNRLIGAVAYGWSFAKDAIAGVTPIGEMKSTLLNLPHQENDVSLTSGDWELPAVQKNDQSSGYSGVRLLPQDFLRHGSNKVSLTPIASPLVVSGVDGRVIQGMQEFFNTYGLHPIQGGGCAVDIKSFSGKERRVSGKEKLVPGASVAAVLVRGDLNAAVVGTVTYAEGDNVLAFGHPFLQTGNADIPMASAHVYTILTSQSNSIKMASPVEIIGRIVQDRRSGIAGTLGETSRMIPCRIEVEGSQKLTYDFEVIDNKLLTPSLVLMAAQSAVLSTEKKVGEKSVNIKLTAQIERHEKPVVVENVFYEIDQSWLSLNHIIQPFSMMLNNQFEKVNLEKIDLRIKVLDTRRTAYIEAIMLDKKLVKPGDSLRVDVYLKPFIGESFCQTVLMHIPEDILPGSVLNVTACDALYGNALNRGRAAGKYLPTNFEQLLQYIENMERNNNLMVRILLPKKGLTYKGEGFPSLPSSMLSIMSYSNQSGIGPLFDEVISRVPTSYVLSGKQSIPVMVE